MSKMNLTEATMLALQGKLEEKRPASRRKLKKENIDVNVDDKTNVSVMDNETVVDTPDATVIVDKKEKTELNGTPDFAGTPMNTPELPIEEPVETVDIPVEGNETIMPEEIVDEPKPDDDLSMITPSEDNALDTDAEEDEEDNDKEESKKVENKEVKEETKNEYPEEFKIQGINGTFRLDSKVKEIFNAETAYVNLDADKYAFICDVSKAYDINSKNKIEEDTEEDLVPRYSSRKSFYGKAKVTRKDNGDEELRSYGTLVGGMRDGKPYSKGKFSSTTSAHQKEYFKQRGFDHNKVDVEETKKVEDKEACKDCDKEICECDNKTSVKENKFNPLIKSINKQLTKYYTENSKTIFNARVTKLNETKTGYLIEARLYNKDGIIKKVEFNANLVNNIKSTKRYNLSEVSNKKFESKSNNIIMILSEKDKITECRSIRKR